MVLFCKPRVCGEKKVWYGVEDIASGSPPRMRGKVRSSETGWMCTRITPAYAGKRPTGIARPIRQQDHPRICGEKVFTLFCVLFLMGSPPHMRGKVVFDEFIPEKIGITPAYAGKRAPVCIQPSPLRDHPRICGEKDYNCQTGKVRMGSPPHMRGKASYTTLNRL